MAFTANLTSVAKSIGFAEPWKPMERTWDHLENILRGQLGGAGVGQSGEPVDTSGSRRAIDRFQQRDINGYSDDSFLMSGFLSIFFF